jgi:uncharacterized protein (TIGR02266 family)
MASGRSTRDAEEVLGATRQHPRAQVNHEFQSMEEFIAEYVWDISEGGVFIRTHTPLAPGTPVDLRFTVIADEIETVEGTGVVVRSVPAGGAQRPGMGVAFETLTAASQALVQRITAPLRKNRAPGGH